MSMNEMLKKFGRNMTKVKMQQAASEPRMDARWGDSDGGKVGRPKKAWVNGKRSVKGG